MIDVEVPSVSSNYVDILKLLNIGEKKRFGTMIILQSLLVGSFLHLSRCYLLALCSESLDRSSVINEYASRGIHLGELIQYSIPDLPCYDYPRDSLSVNATLASKLTVNFPVS